MSKDITIRPANNTDKTKVLDLHNNVFYTQQRFDFVRDDTYWKWKYTSNVFGKTELLVAETEGKIVAATALWPWNFTCRGRIIHAYQACDSVVHPDYRGRGIYSKINQCRINLTIEKKGSFLYTFPNDSSLKGNLNVGWDYLSRIVWLIRPLKPWRLIKNLRGTNKAECIEIHDEHRIRSIECDTIDSDYMFFDGLLRTNRKHGYFQWRYQKHPVFHYGMAAVNVGEHKSAAVFMINTMGKLKEMVVVDVIGSSRCTVELFREIIKIGKQYDVHYIVAMFTPAFGMNKLWKLGFLKIRSKHIVIMPIDLSLENKIKNYANWFMTGGMHDAL
jgi:hypothetical protein